MQDSSADQFLVKAAKALADPTRLQILRQVAERQPLACWQLKAQCALAQPTMSHHVNILLDAGLLQGRKEGRLLMLSPQTSNLQRIQALLAGLITTDTAELEVRV